MDHLNRMLAQLSLENLEDDGNPSDPIATAQKVCAHRYMLQLLREQQFEVVSRLIKQIHFNVKSIRERIVLFEGILSAIQEVEPPVIIALIDVKILENLLDIVLDKVSYGSTEDEIMHELTAGSDPRRSCYRQLIWVTLAECLSVLQKAFNAEATQSVVRPHVANTLRMLVSVWNSLKVLSRILRRAIKREPVEPYYEFGIQLGALYVKLHTMYYGKEYGFPDAYALLHFALDAYIYTLCPQVRREALDVAYELADPGCLPCEQCVDAVRGVIDCESTAQSLIDVYCLDMLGSHCHGSRYTLVDDYFGKIAHIWGIPAREGPEVFIRLAVAPGNLEKIVTSTVMASQRQLCCGDYLYFDMIFLMNVRMLSLLGSKRPFAMSSINLEPTISYGFLSLACKVLPLWIGKAYPSDIENLLSCMLIYGPAGEKCDISSLSPKAREDVMRVTSIFKAHLRTTSHVVQRARPGRLEDKVSEVLSRLTRLLNLANTVATDRTYWRRSRCSFFACLCTAMKPAHELRVCKGCRHALYCSEQCQRRDWETYGHKDECRRWAQYQN